MGDMTTDADIALCVMLVLCFSAPLVVAILLVVA